VSALEANRLRNYLRVLEFQDEAAARLLATALGIDVPRN